MSIFETDSEEVVLGTIISIRDSIDEVVSILQPKHFRNNDHALIYECLLELKNENKPIDSIIVVKRIDSKGKLDKIGGPVRILSLTSLVGSGANLREHTMIIFDNWLRFKIIEESHSLLLDAQQPTTSTQDLLSKLDKMSSELNNEISTISTKDTTHEVIDETVNIIINSNENPEYLSGVDTGNPKLNNASGGWQKTDLIILAGRPGMGKSTKALNFAEAALKADKAVAIFTLEMSASQLIMKLFSNSAKASVRELRQGSINADQIQQIKDTAYYLKNKKLYINDKPAIPAPYLRGILRRLVKTMSLDLVIIDYLQLMKSGEKTFSRENEVSSISGQLKAIAKEFKVPVIALSQLGRQVEKDKDKRPQLSDLRESGAIEQDADMVMGIYRPAYYSPLMHEDKDYKDGKYTQEEYELISELIMLKFRNGSPVDRIIEFANLAHNHYYLPGDEAVNYTPDGTTDEF